MLPASAYRNPGTARLRAASWWSERRPRGCRSPTSSPGRVAMSSWRSGGHTRIPRHYRGMDIFWWLERTGRLARTIDDTPRPGDDSGREPSLQLIGRNGSHGERLSRRPGRASGPWRAAGRPLRRAPRPHGTLRATTSPSRSSHSDAAAAATARPASTTTSQAARLTAEVLAAERPPPVPLPKPVTSIDLPSRSGSRRSSLAHRLPAVLRLAPVPVLGAGRVDPASVAASLPARGCTSSDSAFQHRRDSGFIDGARHDAATVVAHLTRRIKAPTSAAPSTASKTSMSSSSGCAR